eukprot:m.187262 g.187262  ORF g.187262 m.187262 type:complete len:514 (+) comp18503_c0_seq2:256-1797(+)
MSCVFNCSKAWFMLAILSLVCSASSQYCTSHYQCRSWEYCDDSYSCSPCGTYFCCSSNDAYNGYCPCTCSGSIQPSYTIQPSQNYDYYTDDDTHSFSAGNWAIYVTLIVFGIPCVCIACSGCKCCNTSTSSGYFAGVAFLAFLIWILASAGAGRIDMISFQLGPTASFSIGIYKFEDERGGSSLSVSNDCDYFSVQYDDCASSMRAKCRALKAFTVLGILATIAAMVSAIILSCRQNKTGGPRSCGIWCTLFAEISFLIIIAIASQVFNGNDDLTKADCSIDFVARELGSLSDKKELGSSFRLFCVAWLLSCVSLVLFVSSSDTPEYEHNYARRGNNAAINIHVAREDPPPARAADNSSGNAGEETLALARLVVAAGLVDSYLQIQENSEASDEAPPPYTPGDGPLQSFSDGSPRDTSVVPMQMNPMRTGSTARSNSSATPEYGAPVEASCPSRSDVSCSYTSSTGRTCTTMTSGNSQFCSNHACPNPGCDKSKSSKEQTCHECSIYGTAAHA